MEKYILHDIETGLPYEVNKEQYDSYMEILKSVAPKVTNMGKPIIMGTGGELNESNDLNKMFIDAFFSPNTFNLKSGQ